MRSPSIQSPVLTPAEAPVRLSVARGWPWGVLGLGVALAVGALNVLWRLGSSSLFIDEVYSWRAANSSVGDLLHRVRVDEVAPPTYYLFLHAWIRLFGSDSEAAMRSLSVIAALATVAAVWWVGRLIGGALVASLAALIVAVSPLVLEYGQEVRAYAWAMFAVTIAAGAVLQAERSPARNGTWIAVGAAAAVASVWLHYSALLVIAPLSVFVVSATRLPGRLRAWFAGTIAVGGLAVLPFVIAQFEQGHQNAVAPVAQLSWSNLQRVVGAPFDRTYNILSSGLATVMAVITVVSVLALLLPQARARLTHPRFVVALAGLAPLILLVLTVTGTKVLISRYDAVAVPFMAVALAAPARTFPPLGFLVAAVALIAAVTASITAHKPAHFYADSRAATQFVARNWKPGEVLLSGQGVTGFELQYYVEHLLPRGALANYDLTPAEEKSAIERAPAVAVISQPLGPARTVARDFAAVRLRLVALKQFPAAVSLQAAVALPQR